MIAPTRPLKITVGVIASAWTTSLATVAATSSEMKAPTKLRTAAMPTATRGGSAWVEIEVATTLAVSWKPFVKSNASAVTTTITMIRSLLTGVLDAAHPGHLLGVLDDDALDDVGDVLGRVDRALEDGEDVLPADHDHRVDAAGEERGDGVAVDPVAVVLEPVDLDPVAARCP